MKQVTIILALLGVISILLFIGYQTEGKTTPDELFEQAQLAEENGYYNAAVHWYREAALQHHPEAQLKLASLYQQGSFSEQEEQVLEVLQQNSDEAMRWYQEAAKTYRAAAEAGDVEAKVVLATMYYEGQGVEENHEQAFRMWLEAAEKGSARAQYYCGYVYWNDNNYVGAFRWLTRAANQGQADAQNLLATMYLQGNGVEKNTDEALAWLRQAAANGNATANKRLENMRTQGQL